MEVYATDTKTRVESYADGDLFVGPVDAEPSAKKIAYVKNNTEVSVQSEYWSGEDEGAVQLGTDLVSHPFSLKHEGSQITFAEVPELLQSGIVDQDRPIKLNGRQRYSYSSRSLYSRNPNATAYDPETNQLSEDGEEIHGFEEFIETHQDSSPITTASNLFQELENRGIEHAQTVPGGPQPGKTLEEQDYEENVLEGLKRENMLCGELTALTEYVLRKTGENTRARRATLLAGNELIAHGFPQVEVDGEWHTVDPSLYLANRKKYGHMEAMQTAMDDSPYYMPSQYFLPITGDIVETKIIEISD